MAGAIAYFNAGSAVVTQLRVAAQVAEEDKRSLRFETGSTELPDGTVRNWLKWKVGEDMWSPPFYEDVDPYRDR
jgi:hypothetical protein